jgi:phage-related protein
MEGTDGIYEVRVEVGSNIYRAFAFFDEGQLIVLGNAFQKKTQKTPKNELDLAKK